MSGISALVASLAALALTVTKVVDLVRNLPWFKGRAVGSWVWNVVAFVVGLAFALGWQINLAGQAIALVPALAHNSSLTGVAGQALTGVAIGGAAGFFHELLDSLSSVANKNNGTQNYAQQS